MVLSCSACPKVDRFSLLRERKRAGMEKCQEVKKHVHLQDRRGSNVSLVLDMSSLSNTEPISSVSTPRDVTVKLLNTTSHVLTQRMLQQQNWSLEELQEEFAKIPSNFASAEELDIPRRAAKDRYKSILPSMFASCEQGEWRDGRGRRSNLFSFVFFGQCQVTFAPYS
nr:tyrosine-protein phosphatase non-receptor type 7-like [Zootoca vivipara]